MSEVLKVSTTKVFRKLKNSKCRIVVNVGGARSSKSYSSYQWTIEKFNNEKDKKFLVCRKSFPFLRMTAYKDIVDMLKSYQRYYCFEHNKTEHTILNNYNNNYMLFSSIDDPDKIKSTSFNYILMEEGIDFTWEDFMVLVTRLSAPSNDGQPNQLIINLNPSDVLHWIHTKLETGPEREHFDIEFIYSDYRDNPFLPDDYVKTLQSYEFIDPEYFKIYALGEWATQSNIIFPKYRYYDYNGGMYKVSESVYGIDFGYNAPTVLSRVQFEAPRTLYLNECFYERELDYEQLLALLNKTITNKNSYIYADPEDPRLIDYIYKAGFNIHKADKAVLSGIRYMKQFELVLNSQAVNADKELKSYKWKTDKNGNVLDEPIKANDHWIDASRYAVYSHGPTYWTGTSNHALSVPSSTKRIKDNIFQGY